MSGCHLRAAASRAVLPACATAALLLAGGSTWASKQIDPEGVPFKSTLQRTWDAMDRTPPSLSTVIEHFDVTEETVPSAVIRLANEQGVLCGLYVVPWPEAHTSAPETLTPVSATFQNATVAQILDGLVALDPRFTWREDRGVINVALASSVRDPTHPLNVRLPLFAADEVPYLLALFAGGEFRERVTPAPLFEEVYLATGLLVGTAGSGPRLELYPPVTITAEGWTTIDILNEMARQLKLSWYVVDRKMFGGRDIGFSMGVDLIPLPTGQPAAPAEGQGTVALRTRDTPCPCSASTTSVVTSRSRSMALPSESRTSALIPLRESLVADGFSVAWDAKRREALAQKGATHLSVIASSDRACLDGILLTLPRESAVMNGRLHVPGMLVELALAAAGR